jgi:serine/threonine protein kinase/formylglycine-generating enzyme required for sulfatase activity
LSGDPEDEGADPPLPFDTDAVALGWSRRTAAPEPPPPPPREGARYEEHEELGRGAMGIVVRAWDRDLEREVALKRLVPLLRGSDVARARFVREARIGALEHPNIVPVHELGHDEEGSPFLVMRRLSGRTLRELLDVRSRGAPGVAEAWNRARLLRSFVQLCTAVAYAHSRRVLHRDIKPENVIVGDYGEVQLLDWGVGARFDEVLDPAFESGEARGTPGYIAPEFLQPVDVAHPERTDVYALGAVLYELLTGTRPWADLTARQMLDKTVSSDPQPPRRRAPWLKIPAELEEICLAALHRDPALRIPTAQELARRVEEALAGERESRRLQGEAEGKVLEADAWIQRLTTLRERIRQAEEEARVQRSRLVPWSRVEAKRLAWRAEDRASALRLQQDEAFDAAHRTLLAAIERVPDHAPARSRLAKLWWGRLEDDEERGDGRSARRSRAQVELWDDGTLAPSLAPGGHVTVISNPPDAAVHCYALADVDRMLLPGDSVDLGLTPVYGAKVQEGSQLLMLEAPGCLPTRRPLLVRRGRHEVIDVWLPPWDALPPGMVYVPAGTAILGGARDRGGYGVAAARREALVPGFALSVFPVTFSDYLEFLEDVERDDPEGAQARWPHLPRLGPLVVRRDGRLVPSVDTLRTGDVGRDPDGWRLPVVGVSWDDAEAWCAWKAEQLQLPIRLPREDEWEKAGRGVDGRLFPWGPTFEPGFATQADASPEAPGIVPVGQSGMDESVYGVRDLQGGVAEWCVDWFDEEQRLRALRGSHWRTSGRRTLAARMGREPAGRWDTVGFRAACTLLPPAGG